MCNSHCRENGHNHSHSNSPASDDNGSASNSDSNPSLDTAGNNETSSREQQHHHHHESHGLAHGLALLKKKRKKFSASRNTSPIVIPPGNPVEHAVAVCVGKSNKKVGACESIRKSILKLLHSNYKLKKNVGLRFISVFL